MILVGLTGSIGMGKSTAAQMFASLELPVHSADDTVHRLYSGRAAPMVEVLFPGTVENGTVDRAKLSARVLNDEASIKALEALIHPLVREEEEAFLEQAKANGAPAAILDIPLLFETGRDAQMDEIVVVSAPFEVQKTRVLARPNMTEEKFQAILARQVPDAEKRARATHVVETDGPVEATRERLREIASTWVSA